MSNSKICKMQDFDAEFQACLDEKGLAPNEHFAKLVDILEAYNEIYIIEIHPQYMLVHKANRGGLLVSPHNCHRNAENIRAAGADLSQLTNSYCVELDDGPLKQQHVEKNVALHARANGLISPVTGAERYTSIGCGHTSQFCKLAHAGGKTSSSKLKMAGSDKISLEYLCADANFSTMVHRGWQWKVVKAHVDRKYPKFATIAQRALNTRNSTNSQMGELEACKTLTETIHDSGFQGQSDWKQLAIDNIDSLCAPCRAYAGTLLDFVIEFGGGSESPVVEFMDSVAKQFQANVTLGETYWKAITYTRFADKVNRYPLIRAALILVNLTCDKLEDGVARLLRDTDVKAVAAVKNMAAVAEAESVLLDAMNIDKAMDRGDLDLLKPLGQLFVRVGLLLTKREKFGREGKSYTMDKIKQLYLDDISRIIGTPISYNKWFTASDKVLVSGKPAADSLQSEPVKMATLEDHHDPNWIIGQHGFKLGSFVVEKGHSITGESFFVIFSVGDMITLHQVCAYNGMPKKVKVSISELTANWSITKQDPPVQMKHVTALPAELDLTKTKNSVWAALIGEREKHADIEAKLTYFRRPDHVRTTAHFKPGELVLVPATFNNNIYDKEVKGGACLGKCGDVVLFAVPPAKPPMSEDGEWGTNCIVSAYWWVRSTDSRKIANMQHDKVDVGGYTLPVLVNHVEIPPHEQLFVYVKPKARSLPLQNVVMDDDGEEEDDVNADACPKAKAKSKAPSTARPKAVAKGKSKAKAKARTEPPSKRAKK